MIKDDFKDKINVCFSSDNNYALYLGVAIKSLAVNSSPDLKYNIFILTEGLIKCNIDKIKLTLIDHNNISLKIVNVANYLPDEIKKQMYIRSRFTLPVYYRVLLPEIFKECDKIIYLDGDIVILADVADLYNIDMGNSPLGAANDTGISRGLYKERNNKDAFLDDYLTNTLRLTRPYEYFQSGVLLMNLEKLRKVGFFKKFMHVLAEVKKPRLPDQDIMNAVCQRYNMTRYVIPINWNLEWHIRFLPNISNDLPPQFFKEYEEGYENPKIIHYASGIRPWNEPDRELASYFWHYARQTSFYEELLWKLQIVTTSRVVLLPKKLQKTKIKYLGYCILSKLTFGKIRNKFKNKQNSSKNKIRKAEQFLKNKQNCDLNFEL